MLLLLAPPVFHPLEKENSETQLDMRGIQYMYIYIQNAKQTDGQVVVSTYNIMLHPLIISHPPTPTPGLKGRKQTLRDLPSDWTSQDGRQRGDWADDPKATL